MKPYETAREELPRSLQETFSRMNTGRSFEKNAVIYSQGEDADCFYYLKKGRVRIFMASEEGAEKTLSVISSGNILGEAAFFDGKPRISSARTVIRSELVPVTREMLRELIRQSPDTAMALLRLQAQTIRMLSSQLDSITFVSVKGRIAQFLLRSLHSTGVRTVVTTHEEIAAVVGASRVTVSKLITQLCAAGIIRTGYGFVTVLLPEELEKLAAG